MRVMHVVIISTGEYDAYYTHPVALCPTPEAAQRYVDNASDAVAELSLEFLELEESLPTGETLYYNGPDHDQLHPALEKELVAYDTALGTELTGFIRENVRSLGDDYSVENEYNAWRFRFDIEEIPVFE